MKRSCRLTLERLEDRDLLATWGVPWPNPQHVTVSFVPDGTQVYDYQSSLFQTLNSQATTSVWETAILQALQTWAVNTNINLAVVNDGGQPIGTSGLIQGDSRFGDIRIAAQPLGSQVVAITGPFDLMAGTQAGDMILNSSDFGTGSGGLYDLFSVALHEAGHSFGLPDITSDQTSAMYAVYSGIRTGLNPSDIAQIQSLYGGPRIPDGLEGTTGNSTFATAATLTVPNQPADITTSTEADFFKFVVPSYSSGTMTVQVQASGISLLTSRLTVFNAMQQAVSSTASTDPLHNDVTISISNAMPGSTYYFEVQGARSDAFGIGGYRLKVNISALSPLMITSFDTVYTNTSSTTVSPDNNANNTIATAMSLDVAPYIGSQGFNRAIMAGVWNSTDVDFFQVVAQPTATGAASTMVAMVSAVNGSTLLPHLTVFDQTGTLVNAGILVNDSGTYVVQVVNATPNATYYVEVSADPYAGLNNTGTYLLGVDYIATPIVLTQFATDILSGSSNQDFYTMSVPVTQITHFVLSASDPAATVPTAVRMTIYDQYGNIIFTLDAIAGQTVSDNVYLTQGTYTISFVAATNDGSALSPFTYNLLGETITDPLDAIPINPLSPPPSSPTPVVTPISPTNPPLPTAASSPWTPPAPTVPPPTTTTSSPTPTTAPSTTTPTSTTPTTTTTSPTITSPTTGTTPI
jgi:hypothetical protein